jgi:hypothetical protein
VNAPACPPPREPSRPNAALPPGACDSHAHVFGPASRFPCAERDQRIAATAAALSAVKLATVALALAFGT